MSRAAKVFFLMPVFILFINTNVAFSQESKPWYKIKKIEELRIFVFFPDYEVSINRVYDFHLRLMATYLKADKSLNVYIYNGDNLRSIERAKIIKKYLEVNQGAPGERLYTVLDKTKEEGFALEGERIEVFMTRSELFEVQSQRSLLQNSSSEETEISSGNSETSQTSNYTGINPDPGPSDVGYVSSGDSPQIIGADSGSEGVIGATSINSGVSQNLGVGGVPNGSSNSLNQSNSNGSGNFNNTGSSGNGTQTFSNVGSPSGGSLQGVSGSSTQNVINDSSVSYKLIQNVDPSGSDGEEASVSTSGGVGEYDDALDKRNTRFKLGLIGRLSQYSEVEDTWGTGLDLKLTLNAKKNLRFIVQGRAVFLDDVDWKPEIYASMGFESIFETAEVATKIFYKTNYAQNVSTFNFQDYEDIGLAQEIRLKIFKKSKAYYRVGVFGEFSFSNNLSQLTNSNIVSYGFKTDVLFRSGYSLALVFEKRKLRNVSGFGVGSEHFGLIYSYSF